MSRYEKMKNELIRLMYYVPDPEEDSMFNSPKCRWCGFRLWRPDEEEHDPTCFAVSVLGRPARV